jgi:hypothetical protein
MAIYDDTQKQILLSIPIEDVMSYFGKSTKHDKGGMYYSPLRDEMNMSFHVDVRRNLWYDFGIAEGGGLVDLVIRLSACRRDQALDVLAENGELLASGFEGARYDVGDKFGYIKANVEFALMSDEIGEETAEYIKELAKRLK